MHRSIFSLTFVLLIGFLSAGLRADDVIISVNSSNPAPAVGEAVTLTVQVANVSGGAVSDAAVRLQLPPGLTLVPPPRASHGAYDAASGEWKIGNLLATDQATLRLATTVSSAGAQVVLATVAATGDSTPNNNRAALTIKTGCATCKNSITVSPPTCGPLPCCVNHRKDACVRITLNIPSSTAPVYSSQGVNTFIGIFSAAASRGVENVAIRAFNVTSLCPPCADCPEFPCDWQIVMLGNRQVATSATSGLAFDLTSRRQVDPATGMESNPQRFQLNIHPQTNRWFLTDLAGPQPPQGKSNQFDLETGLQINPSDGMTLPANLASHRLVYANGGTTVAPLP